MKRASCSRSSPWPAAVGKLGVPFHTDAVQAVGKIPVHFAQLQVTALTMTGHKFHGPRGVGALLLQRSARIDPILFGGFQQMGLRPGTEPLELAVGLHHALQVWQRDAQTARRACPRCEIASSSCCATRRSVS